MTDGASALWTVAPGEAVLRHQALPALPTDWVRVRMLASAISRGTESLVFHGRVPAGQHAAMRCPWQEGELSFPVKYGYCAVGRIEAGPPDLLGRRVFALHPHQDCFQLPASAVVPVPDAVPDTRATLAANMETAINGLWDAEPHLGERVVLFGAGLVGLLTALLVRQIPGVELRLVEPEPSRAAVAAGLGIAPVPVPEDWADLAINASGSPAALAAALRAARFEARLLELSWYGDREVTLPLGEAFHSRRLRILSSQVGSVAAPMRARRSHGDRLRLALALLADPVYDRLIGRTVRFADLPAALPGILGDASGPPATVVTYEE